MKHDGALKAKAVYLRSQGKTYGEILEEVPVAKSTLSLWLRDVGLSKRQKQRITKKKQETQKRAAALRKESRISRVEKIYESASKSVGKLSAREKLLIGVALYWAEGSKEHATTRAQGIDFGNTDPAMLRFFISWLRDSLHVAGEDLRFSLYIHENHKNRLREVKQYWRRELDLPALEFVYVYYKKHNIRTVRKNTGSKYYGTLRVRVAKSSHLQRKTMGIVYGITGDTWRIV